MKRTLNLLTISTLLLILVPFSSCKDDDEPSASGLIGTWKEVSFEASGCTDPNDNEPLSTCSTTCETIVVTATTISFSGTSFPYTASGNTITVDGETVTWSISGTTLTITSDGEPGCTNVSKYTRV